MWPFMLHQMGQLSEILDHFCRFGAYSSLAYGPDLPEFAQKMRYTQFFHDPARMGNALENHHMDRAWGGHVDSKTVYLVESTDPQSRSVFKGSHEHSMECEITSSRWKEYPGCHSYVLNPGT